MDQPTTANLLTTIFKVLAPTNGLMVALTLGCGAKTKCMESGSFIGQMDANIKADMLMTRRMATEFSFGLMAESIRDFGMMVSNTELGNIKMQPAKQNQVSGKMEKEFIGLLKLM